jgi:hypothetical protein
LKLDDEYVQKILQGIPGSKKAAQGVLIPVEGGMFHLRNMYSHAEREGLTDEEKMLYEICSKKEIIRLRSINGPHDYLLRLRANAISECPRAVRVLASRKNIYEEGGHPWSLSHYYHSKDYHHKTYIKLLDKKNRKKIKNVPSGLAHIDEVNALCIKSLAGDVVIVSESLEYFFYFMTIAFYGDTYGIELIDQVDALIIAIRIIKGSEALDFDIDSRGELPHEIERAVQSLVNRQMQFTFGHEYAHYLCGHIPSAETLMSLKYSAPFMSELALYNHALEYEADYYALKNIEIKKEEFGNVVHGGFSVLIYLHFIEEFSKDFGIRNLSVSDTHPAPKDRIYKLLSNLGKNSPVNKSHIDEMFLAAQQRSEVLQSRIEYLADQYDDILGFYGSVYLPSYKKKRKIDRVDF